MHSAATAPKRSPNYNAFDVTVTYDKPNQHIQLAATVTAELVTPSEALRPPQKRSQGSGIAGARYAPISGPAIVVESQLPWHA